jgi:lysosomal alpha-mannosidase
MNISANYYPINSAIALRDFENNKQATVLTERSTGGSAELIKGTIEIIQNRRLIKDDNRGVSEPLNETDSQGFGMKFNSRYYIDIFDRTNGESK